jgi:hypothetical protein
MATRFPSIEQHREYGTQVPYSLGSSKSDSPFILKFTPPSVAAPPTVESISIIPHQIPVSPYQSILAPNVNTPVSTFFPKIERSLISSNYDFPSILKFIPPSIESPLPSVAAPPTVESISIIPHQITVTPDKPISAPIISTPVSTVGSIISPSTFETSLSDAKLKVGQPGVSQIKSNQIMPLQSPDTLRTLNEIRGQAIYEINPRATFQRKLISTFEISDSS